jgi:hypothetical protein
VRRLGRGLGRTYAWLADGIARLAELAATLVIVAIEQLLAFAVRVQYRRAQRLREQVEAESATVEARGAALKTEVARCDGLLHANDPFRARAEETAAGWIGSDVTHGAVHRKWEREASAAEPSFAVEAAAAALDAALVQVAHFVDVNGKLNDAAALDARIGELVGPSRERSARVARLETLVAEELARGVDPARDPWDSLDFLVLARTDPAAAGGLVEQRLAAARREAAQVATTAIVRLDAQASPVVLERSRAVQDADANETRRSELVAERDVRRAAVEQLARRLPEPPGPRLRRAALGADGSAFGAVFRWIMVVGATVAIVAIVSTQNEVRRATAAFVALIFFWATGVLLGRALGTALLRDGTTPAVSPGGPTAIRRQQAPAWVPLALAFALVVACLGAFVAAGAGRSSTDVPNWYVAVATIGGLVGLAIAILALAGPLVRRLHSGTGRVSAAAFLLLGLAVVALIGSPLVEHLQLGKLKITAFADRWSEPATPLPPLGSRSFWLVARDGSIYGWHVVVLPRVSRINVVAAATASAAPRGLWLVDSAGRIRTTGKAKRLGDVNIHRLVRGEKAVSIAVLPHGDGYWVFTNLGRVVPFGKAKRVGDLAGKHLLAPIVAAAVTPTGKGYYLVGSDGAVYAFGDAKAHGGAEHHKRTAPIVAITLTRNGSGYWLVGADGGVYAFHAPSEGSAVKHHLGHTVVGGLASGEGYVLVDADGRLFGFSGERYPKQMGLHSSQQIVAVVAR